MVAIERHRFFVKAVSHTDQVQHLDWKNFDTIASTISVGSRGYLIHEAVEWSQQRKQSFFFFLVKRLGEPYNEVADEEKSANIVIKTLASCTSVKFSQLQFQPIKRR